MLECDLIKVWNESHHMLPVRNQILMASFPISIDLANDKIGIPINFQVLDSQIDPSFDTIDTSFILSHVISAIKTDSGCKWNMKTRWRSNHSSNTIPECIRGTIEHERPSRSWFGSFLWSRNVTISDVQNILIGEFKLHWFIIFDRLMRKIICQHTTFDGFLGSILDIIFSQDHLPPGYSSRKAGFSKTYLIGSILEINKVV